MSRQIKRNDHIYLDGSVKHPKGAHLIGYFAVRWVQDDSFIRVESLTTGKSYWIHESQVTRKDASGTKSILLPQNDEMREPKYRRES